MSFTQPYLLAYVNLIKSMHILSTAVQQMQGLDSHKRKYPKMRAVGIKKHFLSLFLISLALIIPESTVAFSGNETDLQALLSFKYQIVDDPLGVLESWNNSIHVCLWYGITCGRLHKRVTSLKPFISTSGRLKLLNLGQNALEGSIPETLGQIDKLVVLELFSNKLSGSIPSDFGLTLPNLQKIQLSNNRFTGSIPVSLSNASKLQVIDLQFNPF
ncbi:hypothetical protein POM88_024685 [Heracleum sosnowskyi]|uniref:Leucine-rich repeat-containing N-terminal plant-type domain-containing protein n=1 Tax=Heracleum sosnowskyi TaxID=360622 RepID=A0AAD8MLP0_9APIA|nr:hypothetical protein POM88_024685 [Heracleum sosnowskyi]